MINLNQRAGIEEVAGQKSTFPTLGNKFSSHRSRNLGKPPPDFLQPRRRLGVLQFPFDLVDVLYGQAGSAGSRSFNDAHSYVLMLRQVQRLKRPQHSILVYGINLERHATIVQPKYSDHGGSCSLLPTEGIASYKFDYR